MSKCDRPECIKVERERDSLARRLNDRWAQLEQARTALYQVRELLRHDHDRLCEKYGCVWGPDIEAITQAVAELTTPTEAARDE